MEQFTGKMLKGFYALEGIDGAGKTTLVNALKELCRKEGVDDVLMCQAEPTNEMTGLYCRRMVEGVTQIGLPPSFAAYMFAADRYYHLYHPNDGVLAFLEQGKMVLTDRYLYSSIVYQTCMEDSRESLEQRRDLAIILNRSFEQPEKVFFLKCHPSLAQQRQEKRGKEPIDKIDRLIELDKYYTRYFERMETMRKWGKQDYPLDQIDVPVVVTLDAHLDAETLAERVYAEIFS